MRLYSTPLSASRLEITKLAIIETVLSLSIYSFIVLYFGSLKYLVVIIVLAPLTLFRTDSSSEWAIDKFKLILENLNKWVFNSWNGKAIIYRVLLAFILWPLFGVSLRVVSTIYFFIKNPISVIVEMPRNWMRQCICTDFMHPPEILPMECVKSSIDKNVHSFYTWKKGLIDARYSVKFGLLIFTLPFWIIGWIPSLFYRISFKATSIVYLPFIWVANLTMQNPLPVKKRLERFTQGELEKVRRGYSWIIIVMLLSKIGFILGYIDINFITQKYLNERIVNTIIVPNSWASWQITLGIDALLTFFLLFFTDSALARLDHKPFFKEETILNTVSFISFIRAAISIFTISIFFFYALNLFFLKQ
ncbi:MAG: hypothetical protein ABSD46_02135 [Bacteroidota bacterium]